jgi:hypothetical protein
MSKIFQYPHRPLDWVATPHDFTGDNQLGIRAVETTQRYIWGTRYTTWDGRVFKYCNAVAAVYSYHGARNSEASIVSWTANPVAGYAGDRQVTVTVASRSEDDLAGGFFMLYDASATDTTLFFGITGNEATSGSTTLIYLDGAIPMASTTSDYHELFENPYRELTEATGGVNAWIGVPAMTAAASENFWCQTWGPAYISGGETLDSAVDARVLKWGSNASLFDDATKTAGQIAGYQFQGSGATAGPVCYLMCSI